MNFGKMTQDIRRDSNFLFDLEKGSALLLFELKRDFSNYVVPFCPPIEHQC